MFISPFATVGNYFEDLKEDTNNKVEIPLLFHRRPLLPRALQITRHLSSSKSLEPIACRTQSYNIGAVKRHEMHNDNVGVLMVRYKKPFRVRFECSK